MGTADARMGQVVGFRRTGIPGGNSPHLAKHGHLHNVGTNWGARNLSVPQSTS